jgi:hemerythrin
MTDKLFQWSTDLSVGIDEIDSQHRVLIDLLNQLFAAVVERKSDQIIGEILDGLLDYTRTHFALEERLMRDAGYGGPEFDAHLAQHHGFIARMEDIARKSMIENKSVTFELLNFLKHWLRDHITGTDRKYAAALRKAGYCTRQWEREARAVAASRERPWWKFWA